MARNETRLRINLLPKQADFVQAGEKEVLYSGAFGAGKTRALCYKVLERARIPNNTVLLTRKTGVALKSSTLRTLLYPDGDLPPVLPYGRYAHSISDSRISIHNGGEIFYCGCDNPERIGSTHGIGSVAVDEAIELDEDEWTMLLGRCRNPTDEKRQIFAATNPGSPSHFLHKRFYEQIVPERRLIHTTSDENGYLPDDYLQMLHTFTGTRRDRYVLGLWVAFEGLVYGEVWRREKHVCHRSGPWVELLAMVDQGYANPCAILLAGIDSDGGMHIISEFYRTKQLPEDVVKYAASLTGSIETAPGDARAREQQRPAVFIYDPSAADLAASMRAAGLTTAAANNQVMAGINAVLNRLGSTGLAGRPRLTIEPCCENVIREFESYQWKSKGQHAKTGAVKDEPLKEMDHAMDAIRYGVMFKDFGRLNPSVGRDPEDAPKDPNGNIVDDDAVWQ